jgi:uncharacterized protein (DUF4415 family)
MNSKKKWVDPDEIPPQTPEQLKQFRRVSPEDVEAARLALEKKYGIKIPPRVAGPGRPPKGDLKYKHVNIRIAPEVLSRVRAAAQKRGIGYQTLINEILRRAA